MPLDGLASEPPHLKLRMHTKDKISSIVIARRPKADAAISNLPVNPATLRTAHHNIEEPASIQFLDINIGKLNRVPVML